MPLQLLLDISTASARSKGQARRRNQPAASEDARKTRRNIARRERAKCKKAGETRQQLLPSAQSLPPANRAQHGLPPPSTGKVVESVPEMPLPPSHPESTKPPGHADDKTLRATGQSSRYSTAKSKAQNTKAAVREAVQRVEDVSTFNASDRAEVQITPQEQDLNVAGILVEFAKEQHPISPAQKNRNLPVTKGGTSDTNASMQYTRKCLVTSCAYHLDRGFWSKKEKDHHIMTHFEGTIGFVTNANLYSLPWPNFIEDPQNYFLKIGILKRHVRQYSTVFGWLEPSDSTCHVCFRNFNLSGYVEHLDDCIVHAVQAQASAMAQACPVSTCEHDPPKFPRDSRTNEPMVKNFVPSLVCSRCYAFQCQCPYPRTHQEKAKTSVLEFLRPGFGIGM